MTVPAPRELESREGRFYVLPETAIELRITDKTRAHTLLEPLQEEIRSYYANGLPVAVPADRETNRIVLREDGGREQGYTLEITAEGITVHGDGLQGLFYGVQTLRQLLRLHGPALPCLEIRDRPAIPVRGVLQVLGQGRVSRLETLKELADCLAFYKINQLQLVFSAANFPYAGLSECRMEDSTLTPGELLELDRYCRDRYIDLVPAVSCFGHLYELLRTRSWRRLCELEVRDGQPFNFVDVMLHHTIAPLEPGSLEMSRRLVGELAENFTSPYINITCDETFDLGRGRTREACETAGKHQVYIDYVKKILKTVEETGKRPMLWGDILCEDIAYARQLPGDTVVLSWDYAEEPDEGKVKAIAQSGLDFYVCPSVHGYNRFVNAMPTTSRNIRASVRLALRYGAAGLLITDWGDYGHVNAPALSKPGFALGAALAWNPEDGRDDARLDIAFSDLEYGTREPVVPVMRRVAETVLFEWFDMVYAAYHSGGLSGVEDGCAWLRGRLDALSREDILAGEQRLEELRGQLAASLPGLRPRRTRDVRDMLLAVRAEVLAARLGRILKDGPQAEGGDALAAGLEEWFSDYEQSFLESAKPSRLEQVRRVVALLAGSLRDLQKGSQLI